MVRINRLLPSKLGHNNTWKYVALWLLLGMCVGWLFVGDDMMWIDDGSSRRSSSSRSIRTINELPVAATRTEIEDTLQLDLSRAPAGDRSLPGTTIDLYYDIYSDELASSETIMQDPTYDKVMQAFHGTNMWNDKKLTTIFNLWDLQKGSQGLYTSIGLFREKLIPWIREKKPRVFVEMGVHKGGSTCHLAKVLQRMGEQDSVLDKAFIISVDTWLLDLRYVWSPDEMSKDKSYFFGGTRVAGHDFMYFVFLANVLKENVQDKVIPLQTSSLNAILAFISRGIRPDFVYLDASHANPDVFLDLVGVWKILQPGGLVVTDDYNLAKPVKAAVDSFKQRFAAEIETIHCVSIQCWIYKKEATAGGSRAGQWGPREARNVQPLAVTKDLADDDDSSS